MCVPERTYGTDVVSGRTWSHVDVKGVDRTHTTRRNSRPRKNNKPRGDSTEDMSLRHGRGRGRNDTVTEQSGNGLGGVP